MTARSAFLDARVQAYILEATVVENPVLAALRAETAAMPGATMQIGADQGRFMQFLAGLTNVRRYLEIGVYTGYSSLAMALALPADGRIVACDVSEEYTSIARRYWRRGGVEEKIDLRLGPALETLDALIAAHAAPFDMAFIDADKEHVDAYYERVLQLLRPDGMLVVDNALWDGRVADPHDRDEDTDALRALNRKAARDPRVDAVLLPAGDGLLMVRKK